MAIRQVVHEISFGSIPHSGGGDADVFTKNGRVTQLGLEVGNFVFTSNNKEVSAHVRFRIVELKGDRTSLALERTIRIPLPADWTATKILNHSEFKREWHVLGKHHEEMWLFSNQPNSCLEYAKYTIDGTGRDDQGNARLTLILSFDVEVA